MPCFRITIAERHQIDLDAASQEVACEEALHVPRTLDTYVDHGVVSAHQLAGAGDASDTATASGPSDRLSPDERRGLRALVRAGFLSGAEEWEDTDGVEVFFTDRRSEHFPVEEIRAMLSAVRAAFMD